jgi:hypothetical protein
MAVLILALLVIFIICFSAWFISRRLYRAMRPTNGETLSVVVSVLVFLAVFALLTFAGLYLVLNNIEFER